MALCNKCNRELPDTAFYRCKSRPNGLQSRCKECQDIARKERYANDPEFREKQIQNAKEWNESNPERHLESVKQSANRIRNGNRIRGPYRKHKE